MRAFCAMVMVIVLVSPCYAQQIQAGYAKEDITPNEPARLGGYSLRTGLSEGVHEGDRLFVRALAFSDGVASVLFVESDLIGTHGNSAFREKVAAATGVPIDHILCGDVHNHAAPAPKSTGTSAFDQRYGEALVAAARQAVKNLQPVRIAAGEGRSRVAMNRRQVRAADVESVLTFDENHVSQSFGKEKTDTPAKLKEFGGVVRLGANPTGPIDDAVQLVRIDDMAGKPIAAMIHYACHGTSLGGRNSKVSAEWMGRMQAHAEKQIPGLGTIFVQGAAGDINPRVVGGLDGHNDDIHATWALGDEIGAEVVRVYRQLNPQPIKARIELVSKEIELPRTYRELSQDFRNTVVRAPTTVVRIGPLMWVTFPGELFSAIGRQVKAACPAPYAHLMGYTNGSIGYFPTQQAFSQGGYEPATSHLDPTAESVYMREIAAIMKDFAN
jgi:neutral ceramidase